MGEIAISVCLLTEGEGGLAILVVYSKKAKWGGGSYFSGLLKGGGG